MTKQISDTALNAARRKSEEECVEQLLATPVYSAAAASAILEQATVWVTALREETSKQSLLDTFLTEYGLNSEEGVALMCLAEAFLRIPDTPTVELLMQDKLASRDWRAHLGHAESWLVNSSTWALMLTGKSFALGQDRGPDDWFEGLVSKLGQPLMRRAVGVAMQILGNEFVLGETIEKALAASSASESPLYSFDMLGEGARDKSSALRYRKAYETAIIAVGTTRQSGVSIKLSALHPRYEPLQQVRCGPELLATLVDLCALARQHNVPICIDAEESERVQFSLDLFAQLCEIFVGWDDLGMVVQAYDKRASTIIDWLAELAKNSRRCIPVRLVKGAYWDAEIKRSHELGLAQFPVYTRKATTDAAYLSCVARLFNHGQLLYPQFATHNAHTIAAILNMAGPQAQFECQRLHGMGQHLYEVVRRDHPQLKVRVYAPVGQHSDLLAYLVRRLLENGANTSFVNRLLDAQLRIAELLQDPFERLRDFAQSANPHIAMPCDIYGTVRQNSSGLDFSDAYMVAKNWRPEAPASGQAISLTALATHATHQLVDDSLEHASPVDVGASLGTVCNFQLSELDLVYRIAASAQPEWDARRGVARADSIETLADLLEAHKTELYSLLCFEAGKTLEDCVNEVREAVDFCRYYAEQGCSRFESPMVMPGPTGESNELSLHGRGVFVCISPWNFPLAIFLGQVSAALIAGNAVIAKPAEATPLIAQRAIELAREAGIPHEVLQLVQGGADLGEALIKHPVCSGVAFTGSIKVARSINVQLAQRAGPICPLIAETGGQNAMIVDSTALLEQVTDDVVHSAFRSAGQRCSALRLLCLQEDIADSALTLIKGAMVELKVGHPREIFTDVGPIITARAHRALLAYVQKSRECGFEVYCPPLPENPAGHYMAPTLIEITSVTDLGDEQFGPVLHVLRYASDAIEEVLDAINNIGYGLTFGVHTRLDVRAQQLAARSRAGNVYINRNMIGAVVGTQPFGGQGLSGTGPKAGGPNYLPRFATEKTVTRNVTATGGNLALLGNSNDVH